MSEEERKHLMLMEHRRREEVKRLLEDNDDNYLDQVITLIIHQLFHLIGISHFTRTGLMVDS